MSLFDRKWSSFPVLAGRSKVRLSEEEWRKNRRVLVFLALTFSFLVLLLFLFSLFLEEIFEEGRKGGCLDDSSGDRYGGDEELGTEELIKFAGGEDLTVHDILVAPGEVIAKSSYGTLYRAVLLLFIWPDCARGQPRRCFGQFGLVRHPNLVPLRAM